MFCEAGRFRVMAVAATFWELATVTSAAEIIAIRQLDGVPIAAGREGPITHRLRTLYRDAVRRLY